MFFTKKSKKINRISIITPVLNGENTIQKLISSIESIDNIEYEWIIIDGGSEDKTLDLIKKSLVPDKKIYTCNDGFYESLNYGIKQSSFEYYMCVGCDDILLETFIQYLKSTKFKAYPDFIAGSFILEQSKKKRNPGRFLRRFKGIAGVLSNHSGALVIKKQLHLRYGWYQAPYKYLADQLFCLTALEGGATVVRTNEIFSCIGENGFSTKSGEAMRREWDSIKNKLWKI
jgi:hypothetical protein